MTPKINPIGQKIDVPKNHGEKWSAHKKTLRKVARKKKPKKVSWFSRCDQEQQKRSPLRKRMPDSTRSQRYRLESVIFNVRKNEKSMCVFSVLGGLFLGFFYAPPLKTLFWVFFYASVFWGFFLCANPKMLFWGFFYALPCIYI